MLRTNSTGVLRSLRCDVFLGAHGEYYNMNAKLNRLGAGDTNPFIDPEGYRGFVEEREQAFKEKLAVQQRDR